MFLCPMFFATTAISTFFANRTQAYVCLQPVATIKGVIFNSLRYFLSALLIPLLVGKPYRLSKNIKPCESAIILLFFVHFLSQ